MATQTVTPAVTLTWLQKHERLVIVALALGFSTFVAQKAFDYLSAKDALAADKTAAVLAQQAQQVADDKQLVQTATQQYTATIQSLQTQNIALQATMDKATQQLNAQKQAINAMSTSQVAQGIQTATAAPQGSVTAGTDTVTIQQVEAKDILEKLDEIPVLESKLTSEITIESNTSVELKSAQVVIADQTKEISGLNTQIKDDKIANDAEVATLKAQVRKSRLKWFGAGFVTGFVSGLFVSHGG